MEAENKQYRETFQMKYGDGDVFGRVRPAVLMRYVEHVALKHAVLLGVSREFNESHNMVFLIAKQAIEFTRMPRADEALTFVTQPEHSKRVTFRRVTIIYDATGQEVACVDSIWVLMDTLTHRLLRRSPVPFDAQWEETLSRSVEMRLHKPEMLTDHGEITASYIQCDQNGHINNANYFDIVCDVLPIAQLKGQELKRITVNYHRELVLGDTMHLQTGQTEDGMYVVGGKGKFATFEAFCCY